MTQQQTYCLLCPKGINKQRVHPNGRKCKEMWYFIYKSRKGVWNSDQVLCPGLLRMLSLWFKLDGDVVLCVSMMAFIMVPIFQAPPQLSWSMQHFISLRCLTRLQICVKWNLILHCIMDRRIPWLRHCWYCIVFQQVRLFIHRLGIIRWVSFRLLHQVNQWCLQPTAAMDV